MTFFHEKTTLAARGKWRGILSHYGIPRDHLDGKHHPCPLCGGDDRWRFDDKEGRGTSICGHCGARDGMALAVEMTGRAFSLVASEIDGLVGNLKPEAAKPAMTEDDRASLLRTVYQQSRPIQPDDLAHKYLSSRGIGEMIRSDALRFAPAVRDGEGGVRPCMVAMVGVRGDTLPNGRQRYLTMHRTFLRPDGLAKAEMASPRKIMPGEIADGACVMLSDWTEGPIGIAEGIETAMSASVLFGIPVWAALNATMLTKWLPPPDASDVTIFGDNDESHTGHAAAYALSRRLRARKFVTNVMIPPFVGTDWNDELQRKGRP